MADEFDISIAQKQTKQQMRALARDWLLECTPHQAGLLRMLAVAQGSDLNAAALIDAAAHEFPLNQRVLARRFGARLKEGQDLLPALEEDSRLLPPSVVLAMKMADQADQLDAFFSAVATCATGTEATGQLDSLRPPSGYFPLYLKTMYILGVMIFIMLFVIPQFQDMFAEFGLELPAVTQVLMVTAEWVCRYAIFPLTLFTLWILWSIRPLIGSLRRRWSPTGWAAEPVPQPVQNLRALAMAAAMQDESTSAIERLQLEHPHIKTRTRLARANERTIDRHGQWKALAREKLLTNSQAEALGHAGSPQLRSWLLQKMADQESERIRWWQAGRRRTVIGIVNTVLTVCVLLFAVGIFASLVGIILSFV